VTLRELDAQLVRIEDERTMTSEGVDLANAQGVLFLCPVCFKANGGPIGTHSVLCWFLERGVPDDRDPRPGRWIPGGTGIDDLTFVGPAAASVLLTSGCNAHFFVRAGAIEGC
jgi:hypothetical protein